MNWQPCGRKPQLPTAATNPDEPHRRTAQPATSPHHACGLALPNLQRCRLYAACPDSTIASSSGRAWISFDRDADALQTAIISAVTEVRRHGLDVGRVEIAPPPASTAPSLAV